MNYRASNQQAVRLSVPTARPDASAGPHGIALAPPDYGVDMVDHAENHTGLPDRLKAGVERLSGLSMDDVKVHYNSAKPAQLQALAYTQGTDIHVGPGHERYLPHEAWHVVQQKQGRVKPTIQGKGIAINDNHGLEREADMMGKRGDQLGSQRWHVHSPTLASVVNETVQCQSGSLVIQMTAAQDLAAAQANRLYMVAEMGMLSTAGINVYNAINGAIAGANKNDAAAGLRYYWERLIDGFDGKKAEMYEAELLAANGHIPILSFDDFSHPDVRILTAGGNIEATEVKTINSDNTSNVNTLIKGADNQLGKRHASTKKIKIRIESRANLWPDARYNNNAYITNNTDLKNWLTQPTVIPKLTSADEIQIEGINVPYGVGARMRNFWAEVKANGDVKPSSAQVL